MLPKAARLVIFCCCLMHMSVVGSDICFYHTINKDGTLSFLVSQSLAYLLYPLLGWLADVYFTRYKFILYSFITMIMAVFFLIILTALFLNFNRDRVLFIFTGLSISVGLIGKVCLSPLLIWIRLSDCTFIHWSTVMCYL